MDLPSRIRSIRQPNWTDTLHWSIRDGVAMADVDHDWRIWVKMDGTAIVRNKGWRDEDRFPSLYSALAFLDYKVDA